MLCDARRSWTTRLEGVGESFVRGRDGDEGSEEIVEGSVGDLEGRYGGGFESKTKRRRGGGGSCVDEREDWVKGVGLDLDGSLDQFWPGVSSGKAGEERREGKSAGRGRGKEGGSSNSPILRPWSVEFSTLLHQILSTSNVQLSEEDRKTQPGSYRRRKRG